MKRCVLGALCGLIVVAVTAGPSHAGGSWWEFDQPSYAPGETAFAWAAVAWEHNPDLSTPDDGPYRAWIVPGMETPTAPFDGIPAGAIDVGPVEISLEPYDAEGTRIGPHHATVRFVVPDVPPGEYSLLHCNTPCRTLLGDILYGTLRIEGSGVPATTTTAATDVELRDEPALGSDNATRGPGMIPVVVVAVVFSCALGVVLGDLRRRHPRPLG